VRPSVWLRGVLRVPRPAHERAQVSGAHPPPRLFFLALLGDRKDATTAQRIYTKRLVTEERIRRRPSRGARVLESVWGGPLEGAPLTPRIRRMPRARAREGVGSHWEPSL
jgi:hypothetical protein